MSPSLLRIAPRSLRPIIGLPRALHTPSPLNPPKPKPKPKPKPIGEEEKEVDTTRDTHENTLSSSDDLTAHDKGSFNPLITDPELERLAFAKEHEVDHSNNPLEYSPANLDVSRQCPATEDRAEGAPKGQKHSTQGHPKKGKEVPTTPSERAQTWSRWLG